MQTEEYSQVKKRSLAAFSQVFKEQPTVFELTPIGIKDEWLGKVSPKTGIFRYHLEFPSGFTTDFVGKWKSRSIILDGARVICAGDPLLLIQQLLNRKIFGFNDCEKRENTFYRNVSRTLSEHLPNLYWAVASKNGTEFLALEEIKGAKKPNPADFFKIIDTITDFHAKYYSKTSAAAQLGLNIYTENDYKRAKNTLLSMWRKHNSQNVVIFTTQELEKIENFIKNIDQERAKLSKKHQTLTHNDFSRRNIFIKNGKVIIFDWEMACWQNPEHDFVELLAFDLEKLTDKDIILLVKRFRAQLSKKTGKKLADKEYFALIRYNLLEFAVNKMSILRAFNVGRNIPAINRLPKNVARLIRIFGI